ncbi:hypothetical protein O181_012910 [Austropuccinia psidii MF-1]|uniref:Reverse transcriptase Ty1/copia-type domain-containing protein n=1 Tax=Austropuccinia psidii MF-1 TaxID=1389203 RepID=A0A9Q3BY03_9BASI|nr:hypothetical protein [Austropuccinia psidii MF-1]
MTINKTTCLLKDSGLDSSFWAKAANMAVYLKNLTPSKNINFEVPFKRWFNKEPSLKNLQPFGCLGIILKQKLDGKFDESGSQGICLAYGETQQSYQVMDSGNVKITHHVKFLLTEFPLLKIKEISAHHHSFILVPNETETLPVEDTPISNDPNLLSKYETSHKNSKNPLIENPPTIQTQQPSTKGYMWVPENEILGNFGDPRNILTHQRQQKHHPNLVDHLSLDPKTYQEAINGLNSQGWKNAIKAELNNMNMHNVLSPVGTDPNNKPLSTTWVFKRKTDENGNLSKYKARLCIRGFNQKEGVDYSENRNNPFLLFVHVDNIIFGQTWNEKFKNQIKTFFEMEDLGYVKYALGIRISQNKEHISLIQDTFIHQILNEFNVNQVRPPSAPLPSNYKDLKNLEGKPVELPPFNFRRAVGLLQYLVQCTQPDLSFATSFLSQFLEYPKDKHYKAIVHTLKYLSGTRQFTLNLGKNLIMHPDSQIYGFTDSHWGGGTEKKSFSGSLIYFHGALGWRAHKQKVVALSSAEAEYNVLTESAQDLSWVKQLIYESTNKELFCVLHSDNQSAIAIASNPVYHHGTRHIKF